MTNHTHEIILDSEHQFGARVPSHHLGYLLADLPIAVRGAASMAVRNRSRVPGPQPEWLSRAGDLRFVGHSGNGATHLRFELPSLESAAPAIFQQQQLFDMLPDGRQTGLDLLIRVVSDVTAQNADSEAFDAQMLRRVSGFRRFFRKGPFTGFRIVGSSAAPQQEIAVTSQTCETSAMLYGSTPRPQRVRIAGALDKIEASTQRFALLLDSGERVSGVFPGELADRMAELWRTRVLVMGKAVYRASGRLLRVEADDIQPGESAPSMFSEAPLPGNARLDPGRLRRTQGPRSGMAAIMGEWPGDETDEDIEAALEQLS